MALLESCCFPGLTLSGFRGKTIVVVGKVVEPYICLMSERVGFSPPPIQELRTQDCNVGKALH
jgi:hypothetical protein